MATDTDVKHQLIEKLTQLDRLESFDARSNLLEAVPGAYLISRVPGNARDDLQQIFDFAILIGQTDKGIPALEIVHRNTMRYVPAHTELSATIEKLFGKLLPPIDEPKPALDDGIPFVNRQDELNNILSEMAGPYHVIEAPAGFGKTKIMMALQARFSEKEKNYLCGFANALNKQSFVNVITNLCESLQLPEPRAKTY